MKIVLLSPYHSGSHQAWAEGFAQHSTADVQILSLPGRFWKWRMHGSAVTFAQQFIDQELSADLIIADSMLDLTTFQALTRSQTAATPTALYMHENQLTYPLPADPTIGAMRRQKGERDYHYIFVNYTSMLAADTILFNSHYHKKSWFDALPNFLKNYPDHNNLATIDQLLQKSSVLPVGIHLHLPQPLTPSPHSPLILWNQRWEYDKNPEQFFDALSIMKERGTPFRLAICGENFSQKPQVFDSALTTFADELIVSGYLERDAYQNILADTDIVLSTAIHEFFGISIVEAIANGAFPLLPNRLSYPEIIPNQYHTQCLYEDFDDLLTKLESALQNPTQNLQTRKNLAKEMHVYAWQNIIDQYDDTFGQIAKK